MTGMDPTDPNSLRDYMTLSARHFIEKWRPKYVENFANGDLLENQPDTLSFGSKFNKSSSTWIIVAFSDINYFTVAKLWYDQMTEIGYNIHNIACLDTLTYKRFQQMEYRSFIVVETSSVKKLDLTSIWKARIGTIQKFLNKNLNVFISDVDTIWLRYMDLDALMKGSMVAKKYDLAVLPERKYDSIHALGTTFPNNVFRNQGFVLCGCFAGYRSNQHTKDLFSLISRKCEKGCDDQETINNVLMDNFKMEYSFAYGSNSSLDTTDKRREGVSSTLLYNNLILSYSEMQRGCKLDCRTALAISPLAPKTSLAKIKMFIKYRNCFQTSVKLQLEKMIPEMRKKYIQTFCD